jgi:hypothetical protein
MGTVLEMSLRLISMMICAASLSACGSSVIKSAVPLLKSAVPMVAAVAGGAAQPSTPTIAAPSDASKIWLTLPSRSVKFEMAQISNNKGVTVFAAKDGSQVFLKGSILVGTRGFGRDLMSADGVALADLTGAVDHRRDFYDLDGTDTMIRHSFSCKADPVTDGADQPTAIEACASEIGTIHNEYWFGAGNSVVKSKQWISQGVGYAIIEPKTD